MRSHKFFSNLLEYELAIRTTIAFVFFKYSCLLKLKVRPPKPFYNMDERNMDKPANMGEQTSPSLPE